MNFSSRSSTPVIHFLFLLRSVARSVKRAVSTSQWWNLTLFFSSFLLDLCVYYATMRSTIYWLMALPSFLKDGGTFQTIRHSEN